MARKRVRVISRNGKRYLSLAYAAPLIGYHKDYLGQLIRRGKLKGERIGTTWFIEESIFTKFCEAPHTFISSKESSKETIFLKEHHQEKSSDEGDALYANVLGELKAIHSKLADLAGSPPPRKKHSEKDILETQGVVSAQKEDLETSTFPTRSIVTTRHAFQRDEWDTVLFGGQDNEAKKLETPSEVAQVTARKRAVFVKAFRSFFVTGVVVFTIVALFLGAQFSGVRSDIVVHGNASFLANLDSYTPEFFGDATRAMYETVTVLGAKTFRAVASFFGVYAPTDFSSPTEETDKPPRLAQFPQQSETMKEAHVSTPSALEQEIAILRREIASLKNKSVVIESSPDYKTLTETVDTILASYALGGLTEAAVEAKLNALENNFRIAMAGITGNTTANDATYRAVALSNRIDNLGSVTLNNTTVTGTFEGLTDTHIPDTITASLYLPLTGGTLTGTFTGTSASFDTLTVSSLSATSSDASIFIQASTTRLSIFDTLFIGGTATTTIGGDNATSTFASRIIASRAPSLAHTFNVWAVDDPAAAVLDAPFVVNPASAAADTNLFGIAVNDSAKFIVDAEGDIFANSLTTEGSVTVGATTMASLIVENNTTLGDASGDVVTINAGTINFATSTLAFSGAATTTIPNLLTNAWSIATSTTNTPVFTISTEASPFGLIGIGTTSPGTLLAVQGDVFINDLLTVGGAVNATSTLTVGDLSTLAGFISTASSTIGGPFYVQDHLSASSTLTVAGLATLEDGAILGGASSTVSGTLDVTGLSALAGFISSASSTVSAPFHVSDNLSASSTLTVASLATFDSGFISSASSSVSAPLHISDIIAGSSTLVTDQSAYFALQSGSVGIASSTPWGLLSVEMNTTDPAFVVSNQGSSTPSFYIGGVNQNGFIGVGTSTPLSILHIANNLQNDENGGGFGEYDPAILLTGTTTSVLEAGSDYNWIFGVDISDGGKFKIASSTALGTSDRLVIDGAGIGYFTTGLISEASTTISSTLHVSDNFSASSTSLFAGLSLFESGFITQASSTIGGPFYVLDNLSASSTLTVASLATFDSGFISSASSSVSAPLHVSDIIAGSSTLAIDQSAYFALQSGSVGIASSTPWGQFSVEKITTGAPTFVVSDQGSTTPWFTVNEDGNIGIGATSSSQRVNIDGDNPYIAIFDSTSGAEVLIGSDLSRLQLWVDGSEKASLTSGGNFGIGTTSPWGLLSVEQQSGEPVFVVADNGTSTPHLLVDGMGRVGVGSSSPWGALSVHSFLGTGEAYNDENLAAAFVVGSTTAGGVNDTQFVVQRSGSVGIGTTSPQEKLTVINKVHAASIPPNYLASITNANNATDNYGLIVGTNWANTENFVANFGKYAGDTGIYTSYFVVKGDGNVGIGDDTPTNAKLEVNQTGDNLWPAYFLNSAGTAPFGVHIVFTVTKDDNSHKFLEAQDGTTNRAILYSDGDWYNHDGTYGIISDKRLKSNIEDTGNQVDKISQIKVRDYLKYDTKEKKGLGKNETGFVAQELELIYPELVSEIVWNDKETIKAVNTTGLIPYLTRAIQELASSASLQQAEILASKSAISNFQFLISNDAEVSATSSIYIASDGSVGIGSVFSSTTPPSHTLTVDGEVGAYGFVNISARDAKKDIQKISNSQFPISNSPDENPNSRFQILHSPTATPLEKILSTSIYTYRYIGDKTEETRLGLIAEEAPKEVLSLDDKGVDLYKLASFTLAGVQELAASVESQDERIAKLEHIISNSQFLISNQVLNPNDQNIISSILASITGFGLSIVDGVAQFTKLVVEDLFVTMLAVENLVAKTVVAQKLCADDICVNREQLKALLENAGITPNSVVENTTASSDLASSAEGGLETAPLQTEGFASGFPTASSTLSLNPSTLTLVINGANPAYVTLGSTYSDNGALVESEAYPNLGYTTEVARGTDAKLYAEPTRDGVIDLDTSTSTTYTITYRAEDPEGNTAVAERKVIIGDGISNSLNEPPNSNTETSTSTDGASIETLTTTTTATPNIIEEQTASSSIQLPDFNLQSATTAEEAK